MLIYIDLEHRRLQQDNPDLWQEILFWRLREKYRFEAMTGQSCLIVRYDQVHPALLDDLDISAVLVSGNATPFEHYSVGDLAGLRAIYHRARYPTLSFCGGMQVMAATYGAPIGAMGEKPNKDDGTTVRIEEMGFMPITLEAAHPLLDGLTEQPVFQQLHYWEVKQLPNSFDSLASSPTCRIQILAHEKRPLFGVQFHPERYSDEHPDGKLLLRNFFNIALRTAPSPHPLSGQL